MASKMKNIYHKKTSLFYPEDGFHPEKLHGLSEEPNPLTTNQQQHAEATSRTTRAMARAAGGL